MIYQFYFAAEHRERLFTLPLYRGFGLEREVNPGIADNCPELTDRAARTQLVEFGGMLHLWRNPPDDGHEWIGFTSYRQTDKTPVTFPSAREVEHLLGWWDAVAWLPLRFDAPLAMQAECGHPGILAFFDRLLTPLGRTLPPAFSHISHGYFASYFLTSKPMFTQFMGWLYPVLSRGLSLRDVDPFLCSHPKALGYVLERLFIGWYLEGRKRVLNYPRYRSLCSEDWHGPQE